MVVLGTIDLTRSFTDPDGDALCYVIHNAGTTLGNDTETWATAELGRTPGVPGCDGAKLTLTMALPIHGSGTTRVLRC